MSVRRLYEAVLDAAVAKPSLGRIVAGDRIGAAIALRDQHVRIGTRFYQRLANRVRTSLRQGHIHRGGASIVGVARNLQPVTCRHLLEVGGGVLEESRA